MNAKIKKVSYWTSIIVIGAILGFSLQLVKAWTEPPSLAPGGNIAGPLTTGITDQGRLGNLGIGTTTPGARLDVINGGQQVKFLTGANTSGYALEVGVNDDGINFYNNSTIRGFNFKNANGTLITITEKGDVGIGTASPTYKLDIKQGIGSGDIFRLRNSADQNLLSVDNNSKITSGAKGNYLYRRTGFSYIASNPRCPCDTGNSLECFAGSSFASTTDLGSRCYDWEWVVTNWDADIYTRMGQEGGMSIDGITGELGVGTFNPLAQLDLGATGMGNSIAWGGSSGTEWAATIGSGGIGQINLLSGMKYNSNGNLVYSRTGTYAPAGISIANGMITFSTSTSTANVDGANAYTTKGAQIGTNGMSYTVPYQTNNGAPLNYWASNAKYILDITPAMTGTYIPVDLWTFCHDEDGCKFTIAMIESAASGQPGNVPSRTGFQLFESLQWDNNSDYWWRASNDTLGANGNSVVTHIWNGVPSGWLCVFSDADGGTAGAPIDNNTLYGFINWPGHNRTCRLIIED